MPKPTVLVVDDHQDIADLYATYLDDQYNTKVAYGGKEALEKLTESVDLVLLDRRMPGYSGDKVLAEAREEGWDCPIVFVSAVRNNGDESSADDYLEKPVGREELDELVDQNLRRKYSN